MVLIGKNCNQSYRQHILQLLVRPYTSLIQNIPLIFDHINKKSIALTEPYCNFEKILLKYWYIWIQIHLHFLLICSKEGRMGGRFSGLLNSERKLELNNEQIKLQRIMSETKFKFSLIIILGRSLILEAILPSNFRISFVFFFCLWHT